MRAGADGGRIAIAAAGWRAELLPALGGSLLTLSYGGRAVLRPASDDPASPLDGACFPLVPYANRIAHGRFAHAGVAHVLPRNFGDHPHSLHGLGWQRTWRVVRHADANVILTHRHDGGDGWPWPYRAEQAITLDHEECRIALSVTNLADLAVPMGLGLHPYFPCDAATRLTARAERVWLADASMLPTKPAVADRLGDWATGAPVVGGTPIDHAYDGWDGRARIVAGDRAVWVSATGARAFHLYRPAGAGFFCLEPVSHLPDALNRGFPVDIVAPGDTQRLELRLSIGD